MRLIDADALKIPYEDGNSLSAIACAPIIDAVPVVRCKDCKWWMPNGGKAPASIPAVGACGYRKGLERLTTGKWYCADGERKDNATD